MASLISSKRFFCTADELPSNVSDFIFKHIKYQFDFHAMYFRVEVDGHFVHIREADNMSDHGVLLSTIDKDREGALVALVAKRWALSRLKDIYAHSSV